MDLWSYWPWKSLLLDESITTLLSLTYKGQGQRKEGQKEEEGMEEGKDIWNEKVGFT